MKKIFITILLIVIIGREIKAQDKGGKLANKIAQKMKDTLVLKDSVKSKLYNINIQLHNRKMLARQQYTGKDSLSYYIQKIENCRDSLYHSVLTDDKYLLYKSKKRQLVNNN